MFLGFQSSLFQPTVLIQTYYTLQIILFYLQQMSSIFRYYNPHSQYSQMQWDGLQSSKFARTKQFLPKQDIIAAGLNFPNQDTPRGRRHFSQRKSPQYQFRSTLRILPNISHLQPRQSRKRTFEMSFTQPHPRRQRSHQISKFASTQLHSEGIHTFYGTKFVENNLQEYSIQDKMQRKMRVNQSHIRKSQFLKEKQRFQL